MICLFFRWSHGLPTDRATFQTEETMGGKEGSNRETDRGFHYYRARFEKQRVDK
jgi:hypothetical protein